MDGLKLNINDNTKEKQTITTEEALKVFIKQTPSIEDLLIWTTEHD